MHSASTGGRARLLWRVAALALMAAIFVQSSQPSPSLGNTLLQNIISDAAHVFMYAALAALLWKSFAGHPQRLWLALAGAVLYGISDEVHQSFVPERTASVFDILFDALGAGIGVTAVRWLERRQQRKPLP